MNINWPFLFVLVGCSFLIVFGSILIWHNWCIWKGWPTASAIVQKNHVRTLSLLILDGAHKDQILELILGDDDPIATSFPVGKNILVKVHPKNSKKVALPGSATGFLVSLTVLLAPLMATAYKGLMT
jgi:hypothetical protein